MKYAFSSWSLYALLRCRIWQYGRRWKGVGLCVPVTFHAISAAESFWREQKLLSNSSKWAEILSNRRLVKRRKSCIAICRYPNPSALNVFFFFKYCNSCIIMRHSILCQHHRRFQWCHPLLSQSLSLRHSPASQPNLAYSSGVREKAGRAELVLDSLHPGLYIYCLRPYHTAVPAKYFLVCWEKVQWQELAGSIWREWVRKRIRYLVEAAMLEDVYQGLWYLRWLWWKIIALCDAAVL